WTEGRNVQIDIRSAPADVASMRRFAKELAALQPNLIVTESTPAAGAMLEEARTIPLVFTFVADPVGSRFVASLARPGGNATGFTPIVSSLGGGKWVELLKEIAPQIARSHCCSTHQRRRSFRITLPPSELPLHLSAWWRLSRPLMRFPSSNLALRL